MGKILDGKIIAAGIKEEISNFIKDRKEKNLQIPKIASILVGNDGGSIYYQNAQEKVALSLGVNFDKILLEENITEDFLIERINELNLDTEVQGIILQLPLPKHINEKRVTSIIKPDKDIDCLTNESMGRFYKGERCFLPCTPNSVITLLKSLKINLKGKNAVVIGRSDIVGKPVFQLLLNEDMTVTVCHSKTENLKEIAKTADVLVVAIGRPNFVGKEFVKEGAIVIDVGTSSFNGKITGDVKLEDVIDIAEYITPVPGGVGALTTTLLIKNACEALE
ncbi:tetrahydrofolate dehydrogenase/cyclohydrolase catalytic domain-containing protein [Clostridium sp. 'White wine YQ']|uniref:tetrahydrofolate dehydrogenase/cyclohydrolase catalytic domain-containing protein n=1 Tax=Clostridium sp. 'White wine YQ' TaxID=3027474 RepID=UPI0023657C5B|nr:tetrahydrofolate dehydrogenase/cyclohydrolase catalytic domain-containing protein [Clostridium sp. 'White wine YQ']MDD7793936.1 tetrahydrofolate dehydrogenase/cyclohydrolase catalytic domain-containing protein [Clostridium sp. 'White wine YQ']